MLQEERVDSIVVEIGFLGGIHTPFGKVDRLLADNGLRFLALYDFAPDPSGCAHVLFANALFCRRGLRLS